MKGGGILNRNKEIKNIQYGKLSTEPRSYPMNMFDLHKKMTAHLFPPFSSTDERFLALALCGETGELANMIKKRWRDGVYLTEEIRDEIADIRIYLELIAKCFDIEGDKLLVLCQQLAESMNDPNARDERFISLALCGRVGLLATSIETRWTLQRDILTELIQTQIASVRIYLETMALIYDIESDKLDERVEQKLAKVAKKHNLIKPTGPYEPRGECNPTFDE